VTVGVTGGVDVGVLVGVGVGEGHVGHSGYAHISSITLKTVRSSGADDALTIV